MKTELKHIRKKIMLINSLIVVILYSLITVNKELIRPACTEDSFAAVLTGSFPNFIAAFLISLAFVNSVWIRKPKFARLIAYLSSFMVFLILAIEEINPMWGASTHYDVYDIFASGLGAVLAIVVYEMLVRRRGN